MVWNLGSEYSGLVSLIQSKWKEETTNLANTILKLCITKRYLKNLIQKFSSQANGPPKVAVLLLNMMHKMPLPIILIVTG